MLGVTYPGRVAVLPAITKVAAIGVRIARPEVLTICIRVKLRAIAGVFDNLLRQCGSCGSCRNNSGGTNQRVFHLGLLVGFPRPEDGNRHPFRQSTFCMAVLKFNLMAPAERQTYIALTSDRHGAGAIAPFQPVPENKIEFRRSAGYVEAKFGCASTTLSRRSSGF